MLLKLSAEDATASRSVLNRKVLCTPHYIIRVIKSRMSWAGHVARMGKTRTASRVLVGRPEGMKPLRIRSRRRDDIKLNCKEVRWGWICLIWIRVGKNGGRI
jgi:hypothetical protein